MSSVTLLTGASQATSGTGSGVDVSAAGQLRLDVTVRADMGTDPEVDVMIDTGPAATGPWTQIYAAKFDARQPAASPYAWPPTGVSRVLIGNFDGFARVRWQAQTRRNGANPALFLGVAGTSET